MEEFQDYKLIVAKGSDKLSELVNDELEMGYVLYGNHTISSVFIGNDELGKPKILVLVGQAVVLPFPEKDEDDDDYVEEVYPANKE